MHDNIEKRKIIETESFIKTVTHDSRPTISQIEKVLTFFKTLNRRVNARNEAYNSNQFDSTHFDYKIQK